MGRLRRIDCAMPGITRRRRGRGFEYVDEYGDRITDEDVLKRIRALAIPPGWEDVWICADWPEMQGRIEEAVLDLIDRRESPAIERV